MPALFDLLESAPDDGQRTWEEPCDLLACGYHLVPNMEVASLLGLYPQ